MNIKLLILNYLFVILSNLLICLKVTHATTLPNVWDVLRKQFSLNHELNRPEVQNQLRWIVAHPTYVQKLIDSEPFIYHIVTEIKKRNLPGEIALIPMIESAFDPFAYSGAGAAGLWQLMPGTGSDLGLKQDWWFDGRRSIRPSTDAALNYLSRLHKYFKGNWLLAFAAYDSGEGTITRAIKKSRQGGPRINFWTLPVPRETKAYLPRLLALAEVIQYPERYHVQLPLIPHAPYFEEVNIGSQIDLDHAAKLAGISYYDLIKLNPGFNRWATAPYHPYKLLIPIDRVEYFIRNLANLPKGKRVSWIRHQVSAGENLTLIAKKYNTTVNLIKELNQLKSNSLKSDQYILIPSSKHSTKPTINQSTSSSPTHPFIQMHQYKVIHIVQKNESYQELEKKYGVSENEIKHWNMLSPQMPLRRGQQLTIWKTRKGNYVVNKGDNLSTIAKRHHTTVSSLMKLNPQLKKHLLHPGQQIILD